MFERITNKEGYRMVFVSPLLTLVCPHRFNNSNYTPVAQDDSDGLLDDDEEHLLPL